jgi:hypothetical protein
MPMMNIERVGTQAYQCIPMRRIAGGSRTAPTMPMGGIAGIEHQWTAMSC